MPVFEDNLQSIGRTPIVRVNRLARGLGGCVLAKIEGRNPSYSVKCRIGVSMIRDAEQRGLLRPGIQVVEATSGNTGVALAFACAARGYSLTLTMPESMSMERRLMLQAFGARLELTPSADGMRGAVARAESIVQQPGWFMPRQFENPANPQIHFETTGPEIWDDCEGAIDALVCGVGTGGTLTGIGRFLKHVKRRSVYIVAVEPTASAVLSGKQPGRHRIQGIGAGFVPTILDQTLIDEVQTVTDEEAMTMTRRLLREEGIAGGISSGAAMHVAVDLARRPSFEKRNIVVILPDATERYLSMGLLEEERSADDSPTNQTSAFSLEDDQ